VMGDAIAYGIGRGLSEQFLMRRGRWFGYTASRQARARALFAHWGALTVLVTRTLVSYLSSMVSLLAGISRYRLAAFLSMALLGRTLWTAAYMGLGYSIGGSFEYATDFLKNISGLLVSASVFIVVTLMTMKRTSVAVGRVQGG
jgi:membrane protein DedA with SNARE-associated domain